MKDVFIFETGPWEIHSEFDQNNPQRFSLRVLRLAITVDNHCRLLASNGRSSRLPIPKM